MGQRLGEPTIDTATLTKISSRMWSKFHPILRHHGLERGDIDSIVFLISKKVENIHPKCPEGYLWTSCVNYVRDLIKRHKVQECSLLEEHDTIDESNLNWTDSIDLDSSLKEYPNLKQYFQYCRDGYSIADYIKVSGKTKTAVYRALKKEGLCYLDTKMRG